MQPDPAKTPSDVDAPPSSEEAGSETEARHLALRLDDAWLRLQTRVALRRGRVETVIPYTGYGTTSWVRVLARVVRSDPRDHGEGSTAGPLKPLQEGLRGWRNFTSAPVAQATVQVTVGDTVHEVKADRGGVVDARIPSALEPGWHTITLTSGRSGVIESPVLVVD